MAITLQNTPSTDTATITGNGNPITISGVTIGAGQSLVVAVGMRDSGTTITGVSFNTSEGLTEAVQQNVNTHSSFWYIESPTATTADVVVTIASDRDRPKIATAYVLDGCDTADFLETTGFVSPGTTTERNPTISLTTANDGCFLIDSGSQIPNTTPVSNTPGAGQTETIDQVVTGTFTGAFFQSYKTLATAGTTNMEYTTDVDGAITYSAIAINPAAGGSPTAPDAFASGDWSVSDLGTNGDVRINIGTLPSDGGDTITDLEYQLDGGTWVSLGGTTTGNYDISGLTDGTTYSVKVRAVNSTGNGADSDAKNVTPTGVPDAFSSGDWSVADLGTTGNARITITTLPSGNGDTITDLEYQLDSGTWTSLGGTTTGDYDISGLTDGVSTDVKVRAVNSNGNGPDSDTKSVTTTAGAAIVPPSITLADKVYTLDISNTTSSAAGEYEPHTLRDIETKTTTIDSAGTITPNADRENMLAITAVGENFTLANPTGTPVNGQRLTIRILDDGTSRTITFGAAYRAIGVTLPTATTISKTLYLECYYNSADTKWDVVNVTEEA